VVVPDVIFKKRGTTAGTAKFNTFSGTGTLNFNPVLMEENWDTYIERTVPHEVAHFCVSLYVGIITTRSGRRDHHGQTWKSMMSFFGVKDITRCHNYRVDNVKQKRVTKRFLYTCDCGYQHQIATPTHNKIQRRGEARICKTCNSEIKFVKRIR
jgi:SprT protein